MMTTDGDPPIKGDDTLSSRNKIDCLLELLVHFVSIARQSHGRIPAIHSAPAQWLIRHDNSHTPYSEPNWPSDIQSPRDD
jgi:hypothetical protein